MPESSPTPSSRSTGPSLRHTAAGLIRLFLDRAKRLTNYENRAKLCEVGFDLETCAIGMDHYFDENWKFGGRNRYQPFQGSSELATAYETLATELQDQVQLVLDESDELVVLQDAYGRFMSASQNVEVDQLREDMRKLRNLLVDLGRHQNPYQPSIHANKRLQTKPNNQSSSKPTHHVPRKRVCPESEDTRETTTVSPSRSPKKVRLNELSNGTTLTVPDICSESGDEESSRQSQRLDPRSDFPVGLLERRPLQHNTPMPARLANAPLPQPRGRCKKETRSSSQKRSKPSGDSAIGRGNVRSHRKSQPTTAQIASDDPAEEPIDLASAILRAVGRHPNQPPLNHGMEQMLSCQAVRKYKPACAVWKEGMAEAQNQIAREAVRWWQAQGELLD